MSGVQCIQDKIWIPQFGTKRRVDIYLPDGYDRNTKERYPVLYMQDGQNIDEPGGVFGHWNLKKSMIKLTDAGYSCPIVVAVHHAGKDRIVEYSPKMPWTRSKALGFDYLQFLSKSLKAYIDNRYRTKTQRIHTGIGGSSMGGLISLYAAMMYPEIYSKYIVFSPSLWLRPSFYSNEQLYLKLSHAQIYLYAGTQESKTLVQNLMEFKKMIRSEKKKDQVQLRLSVRSGAGHQEQHWAKELPLAIKWLFNDSIISVKNKI